MPIPFKEIKFKVDYDIDLQANVTDLHRNKLLKQEEIQKEIFDVSLKYTRDPAFLGWLFNTFNFTRK